MPTQFFRRHRRLTLAILSIFMLPLLAFAIFLLVREDLDNDPSTIDFIEVGENQQIIYMTDPAYPDDPKHREWLLRLRDTVLSTAGERDSLLIWGGDNLAIDRSFDWKIHFQMAGLEAAMKEASDDAIFVTGNHDINQIRALAFAGRHAVQRFGGDRSRILLTPKMAIFIYDTYARAEGKFDYTLPTVHPDQIRAYEAAAADLCTDRRCLAITGSQFVGHASLRPHWTAMAEAGLTGIVTGDSHESRYRPIPLANGAEIPLLELSPSYGAKVPGEIDLSGRPSGLFTIDADEQSIAIGKVYLHGDRDRTLVPDGLCEPQRSEIAAGLSVDFLLDDLPCRPGDIPGADAALPVIEARISSRYDTVAFDLNFNVIESLSIPETDLDRGFMVYASSKADRTVPTHAVSVLRAGGSFSFVEYDRWMREQRRHEIEIVDGENARPCVLRMARESANRLAFQGCGIEHRIRTLLADGFLFGVRSGDGTPGIATTITMK